MIENQPKTIAGRALTRDIRDGRPMVGSKYSQTQTKDCDPTGSCAESCSTPDCEASCSSGTGGSVKDRK